MDLENTMKVVGARTHNLKNVTVEIPKNAFVVITGKSGSGKSSLAIDTIFAEGQRQYVESLSMYARQFFNQKSATDVDFIEGLQPTICINQNRGTSNLRSTVGTLTEIYDYLRLLFAKVGKIRCCDCGRPVTPQTLEQICDNILALPEKTKVMVLAPMVCGRKGRHVEVFENIRKERLVRVRVDGELYDIDDLPELSLQKTHTIEAITDRIMVRDGIDDRLFESVEMAEKLSGGAVEISFKSASDENWIERQYSTQFSCAECGASCPEVLPRTFSFNSPYGACKNCDGLGHIESFDIKRVVPERSRSIDGGAICVWQLISAGPGKKNIELLRPMLEYLNVTTKQPLGDLDAGAWEHLVFGKDKSRPGLLLLLEKEYVTCVDEDRLEYMESFRGRVGCPECNGTRLNRHANAVFADNKTIAQVCSLPLGDAIYFFDRLSFDSVQNDIAEPVVNEIKERLTFLVRVGLEYLTLERPADSLSGGELQRVRLAKSIGNGLTGTCYVLDEPSAGLHQKDNERLIKTMIDLKDKGNSLIVVEHDEAIIRAADHIVDIGPGAGSEGGQVVAEGTYEQIRQNEISLTGGYLSGAKTIEPENRTNIGDSGSISLNGASGFNLKKIDLELPLGKFVCVTGVSGSGKSTLIYRTLAPAIKQQLGMLTAEPEKYGSVAGLEQIETLVEVDQRPISRTPRGCAATYTGIFADVRKIFAATRIAKQRGFTASRFSFNSKAGWCSECEGHGLRRISMKFMPDVHVACESCAGRRFNTQTLGVTFRDLTIADVLGLSVADAIEQFESFSRVHHKLKCLENVGLGYLPLGQPSTTLSGGEAQRIKLATELAKTSVGHCLYLLDEPTTGLHFDDVRMLLDVLCALVAKGNTVVVIEHNIDVIRCADQIIDLGPEGGERGGEIVAIGSPPEIAKCKNSHTGQCLAKYF